MYCNVVLRTHLGDITLNPFSHFSSLRFWCQYSAAGLYSAVSGAGERVSVSPHIVV